jgi:hypothetical protein
MKIENIELNHTYLIRYKLSDLISSITVLMITDKAYYLRWNRGERSNDTWELKDVLYDDYSLVEDISDFVVNDNFETGKTLEVQTKLVQCHVCKGFGTVPDSNSTAGNKMCPLCFGSKMIPEITEITQK